MPPPTRFTLKARSRWCAATSHALRLLLMPSRAVKLRRLISVFLRLHAPALVSRTAWELCFPLPRLPILLTGETARRPRVHRPTPRSIHGPVDYSAPGPASLLM